MDDSYERPSASVVKPSDAHEGENDQQSDDEDGGPDWTKLALLAKSFRLSTPVIPKRGEKEFEPAVGGGSGLQLHVLERSRTAMFDALRATRSIQNKALSYAVWYPSLARAHVTVTRGVHFASIGYSAPQPVNGKLQKRLQLLPEEALYLIERGSLFCWCDHDGSVASLTGVEDQGGLPPSMLHPPMSVQEAYTKMIGREGLTLERFQAYTYLKRLGYAVTRADPPDADYPRAAPYVSLASRPTTFLGTISSFLCRMWQALPFVSLWRAIFKHDIDWWRPLHFSRFLVYDKKPGFIFRSLRILPAGHSVPLRIKHPQDAPESPYYPFYNLYKPTTAFKKSSPPPPDFQIVVINARTTPMPSLQELTSLYDGLPELPPPPPRQRSPPQPLAKASAHASGQPSKDEGESLPSKPVSPSNRTAKGIWPFDARLHSWLPWLFAPPAPPPRKVHPFVALRAGKKTAVIAVVDSGNVGFFRFMQGAFEERPWL
ncbi:hypothetical protein FISHEDRAFT_47614 [Fistulina hepatica ATCC 64428]|uniref:tRNA-splicing endonuclease subunit Sen54 N-terminal domain-containing protein n=1 Tax=Fistulina hepatica ATCC 64428 TaxID=1128425 RepID=A0A0D7A797_9AGAR|nr:hypothetical protein FISHEDRAFT_47614 [Fistulina hepatica ATCC 64428]